MLYHFFNPYKNKAPSHTALSPPKKCFIKSKAFCVYMDFFLLTEPGQNKLYHNTIQQIRHYEYIESVTVPIKQQWCIAQQQP